MPGVGTFLREDFHRIGVKGCPACWDLSKKMDDSGLQWCIENFDDLVEKIADNAKTRKWDTVIDAGYSAAAKGLGFAASVQRFFGVKHTTEWHTYGYFLQCAIDKEQERIDAIVGEVVEDIRGPHKPREKGWERRAEVQQAHKVLLDETAAVEHRYPGKGSGRGIVIQGGGATYFPSAFACIYVLRKLGCTLPIELWCLDRREVDNVMHAMVLKHFENVTLVDGMDCVHAAGRHPRMWGGWQSKVWSVMYSSFEEVLFLDADNVPAVNPELLFDSPEYLSNGAVFWPDLANRQGLDITEVAFRVAGLDVPGRTFMPDHDKPTDYRPFETGQMLIDKSRHWHSLEVCSHINDHSDFWYREGHHRDVWWIYGDKSTFFLAWEKLGATYAMPRDCDWTGDGKGGAFLQYDFDGKVVFQHRCQPPSKLSLTRENVEPPGFKHHALMLEAVAILKEEWGGKIWDWAHQSPQDNEHAAGIVGRDFTLFGLASEPVPVRLDTQGRVVRTDQNRQLPWRWTIRHIGDAVNLVIAHDKAAIAVMGKSGCNYVNHLTGHFASISPPPAWRMLRGKDELGMWQEVTVNNEYHLPEAFGSDDIILDIGAHVGSFTAECLKRGAGLVIALEPDPQNFEDLAANTKQFEERVILIRAAAWTKFGTASFARPEGAKHTGGGAVLFDGDVESLQTVRTVNMWAVLDSLIGGKKIRFAKFDCEGAEWELLADESKLERIQQVAGEWHTKWIGHEMYGMNWLYDKLSRYGDVKVELNVDDLGWFWAK